MEGIIISSLSLVVALAAFLWKFLQAKKIQLLEQRKLEWEQAKELIDHYLKIKDQERKEKNKMNYCCNTVRQFEYINLGGIKNPGVQFLPFEKVYIRQRVELLQPPGMQIKENLKETIKKKSRESSENFATLFENLYKKQIEQKKALKLIIQGRAGSGKTTLLKWIALQCASADKNFFSRFIPIFIYLKDLGLDPDNSFRTNNLRQLAVNHLLNRCFSTLFFDDAFEDDEIIFLFDGLDEVTDENIQREIIDWIKVQNTGGNSLVITTRESGLKGIRGVDFPPTIPVYSLREFDFDDIEQFLSKWCRNIESQITKEISQEDTRKISIKLGKKCLHLTNTIKTHERLLQLAKNPLLLTIIAILQINRDELQWPMEQHELYEKSLILMINLKNYIASTVDTVLAPEICIEYLSYIALFLVENNCGEIEKSKIRESFPIHMEKDQFDSFLNDMSQKTGLLNETKGKYGFSHVTFREYLAARNFAREKRPGDILEYRNNDYNGEIFKLYVNIADQNRVRGFFAIIIENLKKRDYWKQMPLWEDCLTNIPDENTRDEIEIQLAGHVLNILHDIPYEKHNRELIISLYAHYPLFKHAGQFIDKAWDLFKHAGHPFVQSISSSILSVGPEETRAGLVDALKKRIDDFEKQENKGPAHLLDFLMQNSISFPLIIAYRNNLSDFNYGLEKLRSKDLFLNFLILLTFESLVYILENSTLLKLAQFRELLEYLDIRELLRKTELPVDIDLIAVQSLLTPQDFMEFRGEMNGIRVFMEYRYFEKLQGLVDEYENRYRRHLRGLKEEINTWINNAAVKLSALSDDRLLYYFPGTPGGM